jgi:hypothetical protein|nr:LysM domain-containing protein [Oxalobacteraceae bacterium]
MQIRPSPTGAIAPDASVQTRARDRAQPASAFRQTLAGVKTDMQMVTVQRGDTLMSLTRRQLGSAASQFSNSQILQLAQTVARENGIDDANRIMPGQAINMAPMTTTAALHLRQAEVARAQLNLNGPTVNTPTLDKTLQRAVAKGYMASSELAAVRDKIISLGKRHQFAPDDFARMSLMESDGLNPRASNGSCHGIIQFCAGGTRGAASAGYGQNPKEIMNLSVLQQLDLVDKYFSDTRLKDFGPASLDDLYLTVLTPSARSETRVDAPLNINGKQAAYLYEGRDPSGVITRNSIIEGLKSNARDRLGNFTSTVAKMELSRM